MRFQLTARPTNRTMLTATTICRSQAAQFITAMRGVNYAAPRRQLLGRQCTAHCLTMKGGGAAAGRHRPFMRDVGMCSGGPNTETGRHFTNGPH
jgi:hypothetical protein